MNAIEAILTRRSTRAYKPDPVELEKLKQVVEAGRYAPSGGNHQSNHFFVLRTPEVLRELAALVESAFAGMEAEEDTYISLKRAILRSKQGGYVFHYHAPVLVVIANRKAYSNHLADTVTAAENMMIAANALDLGSCYINQLNWLNEDPTLLSFFQSMGLREDERLYASVALGYPDTEDGLPVRTPLERKGNEVCFI